MGSHGQGLAKTSVPLVWPWQFVAQKAGAVATRAVRGVGILEPMASVDPGRSMGSHAEPAEAGQDTGTPPQSA